MSVWTYPASQGPARTSTWPGRRSRASASSSSAATERRGPRDAVPDSREPDDVAFKWRPDQTAAVSATNPELRGNVQLLTYLPEVTRGEEEAWTAEFVAADSAGLAYVTTP